MAAQSSNKSILLRTDARCRRRAKVGMGYTIAHLSRRLLLQTASAILLFARLGGNAHAQTASPTPPDDPFANARWRAEFFAQAAIEAWNYNPSHEELYGLVQGVTYGLRDGLVLVARQRLYYVSQRRNDSRLLGLTTGLRGRVYRRGRTSVFLQFDVGISDAAVALPPGGTRFNYLAIGGGGVMMRINRRLQAVAALEVIHVSNAGLAGNDRNPDIEAIGPSLGLSIGF
jgi:hypothetical protein